MRILITGAETPLGSAAAEMLRGSHELRPAGRGEDLCDPTAAERLMEGIEAVAHLEPYDTQADTDEAAVLRRAAQGTFVLLHAARKAGTRRFVLASCLDLLAAYPARYVVDETWKPLPDASARSLAPYLAELTVREFARVEPLTAVCLRLGELGDGPAGATPEDAARAVQRALEVDFGERRSHWWLYHICSGERFRSGAAAGAPFSFRPGEKERA